MKKLRIGVIYGGRSGEHEVSVASAASIFRNLDRTRYEPVAIRIEKDGRWTLPDKVPTLTSASDVIEHARVESGRTMRQAREAHIVAHPGEETVLAIERADDARAPVPTGSATVTGVGLDVVFPVLHGPYGEDGTVQGLLELANVPYVGCGVLGSAAGMDKAVMKTLFAAAGLPIVPSLAFTRHDWTHQSATWVERIGRELGYPVFVKPANLGSSVGISKARSDAELQDAVRVAFDFDRKVIVEAAVRTPREIECAVLGNDEPTASIPGEIIPSREFYDYEAKYLDSGSKAIIPAPLTDEQVRRIQALSLAAFRAVEGAGMARVDFLLSSESGDLFVNEVNTIPGFTTISMYPQLWEASGLPYAALVDRLVALAIERHAEKQRLRTSIT